MSQRKAGCQEVSFSVNDRKFKIMEWAPTYALKIKAKLINPLSISIDEKISFENLDPNLLVSLGHELTQDVMSIEKQRKLDFDEYFSEFPEDLYPILLEVLNIQFSRFFGGKGFSFFKKIVKPLSHQQA